MDPDEIDLDQLLSSVDTAASGEGLTLNSESLRRIWETAVPGSAAEDFRAFEEAFHATVQLGEDFNVQSGGWIFHVSRGLAKTVLLGPLVAGALVLAGGSASLTVSLVTMILPFLFEIERTKLSRRNEGIFLSLRLQDTTQKARTVDELYELLPPDVKAQINRLDFLDFIEALELTGHGVPSDGGRIILAPAGKPKLRITFH